MTTRSAAPAANAATNLRPTQVITGPDTLLSYAHLAEPRSVNGDVAVYSVSPVIDKGETEDIANIRAAIEAAYREGADTLKVKGVVPPLKAIWNPLRDGDLERPEDPAYAHSYFLNAKAYKPVDVRGPAVEKLDPSEVYSGCRGCVALEFKAFNSKGNRGISCRLLGVQKVKDGEPLGRTFNGAAAFQAFRGAEETADENDFLK